MSLKRISLVRETTKESQRRRSRLRAAEQILREEYETAQAALDSVVAAKARNEIRETVEQCTFAVWRMRNLLSTGEIPADVAEKLPKSS